MQDIRRYDTVIDMRQAKSDSIADLLTRGVDKVLIREHLEKRLREAAGGTPLRIKLGIDPTSPHIHLGRAVVLLKLRDFQELGHTVALIIGDFTGTIGDTSDKVAERPLLEQGVVDDNAKQYVAQCARILDIQKTEVHYNSSWLNTLSYGEITSQANVFSLAEFIARDNIRMRLDTGKRVSLRELLYPLMQGYDSVRVRADVELGGTDQWFNLLAGRTIQKLYKQEPQDILTTNLIMGTDGRKMSSSWRNTIHISDEPADVYGKVMSVPDDNIIPYFIHITRVPMEEVEEMEAHLRGASVNPRDIKMRLALEITKLCWGDEKAREAENRFVIQFQKKETPEDIATIQVVQGEGLVEFLARSGFVSSKTEARRLIRQGAVLFDEQKITDPHTPLEKSGLLRVGKKHMVRVEVT